MRLKKDSTSWMFVLAAFCAGEPVYDDGIMAARVFHWKLYFFLLIILIYLTVGEYELIVSRDVCVSAEKSPI